MNSVEFADLGRMARGSLRCRLVNRATGESVPFVDAHNALSYSAADAIAAAYGGDTSLCPSHMGFIFGSDPQASISLPSSRGMKWSELKSELAGVPANIQVVSLSGTPEIVKNDAQSVGYAGNSVLFRACTRSSGATVDNYPFGTSGENGELSGDLSGNGMHMYHAVLLGKAKGGCGSSDYTILARATLGRNNVFKGKPSDYELAIEWQVSFF